MDSLRSRKQGAKLNDEFLIATIFHTFAGLLSKLTTPKGKGTTPGFMSKLLVKDSSKVKRL